MRSLAQRLESGTATLYRHFANRSELVAMVVDRMLGEVDLDARRLPHCPGNRPVHRSRSTCLTRWAGMAMWRRC